jgi:aryl-alcohol dehydrogenase-like predicted oxidoreductase
MEIGGAMKDSEQDLPVGPTGGEQPMFFLGDVDDNQSIRAIHYALDHGINFFDTAPAYGAGHSERILGRAFAGRRDKVVIATKFGKFVDEEDRRFGRYANDAEVIRNIRKECEDSLRRLQTDYIDVYQFHLPEFPPEPATEIVSILESLVSEGKIRFYGWSTNSSECARIFVEGAYCTAIQHDLNAIEDDPEQLAICDAFDQASIARGILGMGFLTGKYTVDNYRSLLSAEDYRLREPAYFVALLDKLDGIRDVLTSDGRTLAQGAVAWIWARSDRNIALTGFRTLAQVADNIKSFDFGPLTTEHMRQIDSLLERVPTV